MTQLKRVLSLCAFAALGLAVTHDATATADEPQNACRTLVAQQIEGQLSQLRAQAAARMQAQAQLEAAKDEEWDLGGRSMPEPMPEAEPTPSDAPAMERATRRTTKKRRARPRRKAKSAPPRRRAKNRDAAKADGPKHYSRTNTQEESVDEGDIVKTDGKRIYHVSCTRTGQASGCRNEIRIYRSWPISKAALLGRYVIPPRRVAPHVQQIYLQNDAVAVIMGHHNGGMATRLLLVDVREPSSPRVARELSLDGRFVDSRMIGSRLYLATASAAPQIPAAMRQDIAQMASTVPPEELLTSAWSGEQVLDRLGTKWAHLLQDPGLPRAKEWLTGGREQSGPMYSCSDVLIDPASHGQALLNLAQIDLSRLDPVTGAGVTGYSTQSKVYASEAAFYVADPAQRTNGWQSASLIRKFDLSKGGKPRFVSRATVRGHLLNQFSMSEHQGHLRVATSDGWASNNVYVLDSRDDELRIVGAIENLARNERIFAVRMMGDKGYIVTFRRTDPLYTLDLRDPKRPQVVGELHIEGFSNYLHPLDADHLLAIGQDADARGRVTGFHMQIFDVSDPRRPRRTHHKKLEAGSTSIAQGDHHAFMFEPNTRTLALPWRGQNYWGLIAYRVDAKRGFSDLGRVNHALMYKQLFKRRCRRADLAVCGQKNAWWKMFTRQDLAIDRVVAIDDHLFSLSPSGAMIHRAGRRLSQRGAVLANESMKRLDPAALSRLR